VNLPPVFWKFLHGPSAITQERLSQTDFY
jgi:hypothetical protein